MKRILSILFATGIVFTTSCNFVIKTPKELTLKKEVLQDKIKGGWAGQAIGCTYGGPTDSKFRGTMMQDYIPIKWDAHCMDQSYDKNAPCYYALSADLTWMNAFEQYGFNPSSKELSQAFIEAEHLLPHAAQTARYHLQHGIEVPMSGHWKNNPHANDNDFQISADYFGLIAPAMVNTATEFTDMPGHISNYGDGWYGGAFIAALYANAFIYQDAADLVQAAIRLIPSESTLYQCIKNVIRWHGKYPEDWRQTWGKVEFTYSEDKSCPFGVFSPKNYDAVLNCAYIAIGLLYGENDFYRSMDITTRCGQDSDSNPSTVAGILGTLLGYSQIPEKWRMPLEEVEERELPMTNYSLKKTYQLSYDQALEVICQNGGHVEEQDVIIKTQGPETLRLESSFDHLQATGTIVLDQPLRNSMEFDFQGPALVITYAMDLENSIGYTPRVEIKIDNQVSAIVELPDNLRDSKQDLYSNFELEDQAHHVVMTLLNPNPNKGVHIETVYTYGKECHNQAHLQTSPTPKSAKKAVGKEITMTKAELLDRIKGGWAGQTIGCTYGGPTEFKYKGTTIQDYVNIEYGPHRIKWLMENEPGLYDDVYMDLTFVDMFSQFGLDAPIEKFALAFANADFKLWHANQIARCNILDGIMPPQSGHWMNNPHADCIDFQIESDYAGLMAPAMVNTAVYYTDEIGHIMNYGDGWYGGVFVAAMYANAFIYQDAETIVKESIKVIPKESRFYQCMTDVIRWSEMYPEDWKQTWLEVEKHYSEDVGCPLGVFQPFNIDAVVNSAYIVIGMMYGDNDFYKSMDIATRCGQDSDCNPASVAGIFGVMLGYSNIPEEWMDNLREVEDLGFAYKNISLNDTYQMSYEQALEVIEKNGGTVTENEVTIQTQIPETVRFEQCFTTIRPVNQLDFNQSLHDGTLSFDFKGVGLSMTYFIELYSGRPYVGEVEVKIDGEVIKNVKLPNWFQARKYDLFHKYDLPDKEHHVEITWLNPDPTRDILVNSAFIYGKKE